jgi:hypothetical protein
MEISRQINSESFKKFIIDDEGKRGYLICFKGEANTTLRSFFRGLFLFVFTRRIITMSSYNDKTLSIIYQNYVERINSGSITVFPKEIVEQSIFDLRNEYEVEDKKFWSQNTSKLVNRARILQRAKCYLDAINLKYGYNFSTNAHITKNNNIDNNITSGIKGAFEGFFSGLIGYTIGWFILIAILGLLFFIVELF